MYNRQKRVKHELNLNFDSREHEWHSQKKITPREMSQIEDPKLTYESTIWSIYNPKYPIWMFPVRVHLCNSLVGVILKFLHKIRYKIMISRCRPIREFHMHDEFLVWAHIINGSSSSIVNQINYMYALD